MKRSLKTAISLFLFLSFIAVLASCGIIQTYENIAVQGEVYSFGKQTIILNSILPEGGNAAKFKKDISASDIKLSDALEGKNIDKVTFIDEYNLELELSGNTKSAGGDGAIGTLTVLAGGLESKGKSTCHIMLNGPTIVTESAYSNRFTARDLTLYNGAYRTRETYIPGTRKRTSYTDIRFSDLRQYRSRPSCDLSTLRRR